MLSSPDGKVNHHQISLLRHDIMIVAPLVFVGISGSTTASTAVPFWGVNTR